MNAKKFRALLINYLKDSKMKPAQLARKANVDSSYISKLKSGERKPPRRDVVLRLSRALQLKINQEADLLLAAGFCPL